ncbi:MAG: hypothetical protein CR994_05875 [Maribacter sp.]|nr:MAG: hypothetical protein CR994_05875 [Maribacter sp.]
MLYAKIGQSIPPSPGESEPPKKSILFVKSQRSFFVKKTMANKQIDMRKAKQIFKLYSVGVSKRQISSRPGISHSTIAKYIAFFSLPIMKSRNDPGKVLPLF